MRITGFKGLEGDSPKVTWMRHVYPRVDYTLAPWMVALRQPSQSILTSRDIDVSSAIPHYIHTWYVFL